MIWLWITLCVAITAFLLRGKNIAPHNFMWALIPIDRYGITLMGFVIKPIYIFSLLLLAYYVISGKFRLKTPRFVFISTLLFTIPVVTVSLIRGGVGVGSDVSVYGIFFFTIFCAMTSMSLLDKPDDLRQIKDVLIATAVGYGIVFLSLYVLYTLGIELPDVMGDTVTDNSVFRVFSTMHDGTHIVSLRLRGFFNDANASNLCFISGLTALLFNWINEGKSIKNILFSLIILVNIVLTSSRTALIIAFFIIIITIFKFLTSSTTMSKRKMVFISIVILMISASFIFLLYTKKSPLSIFNSLFERYNNRSQLNDRFGRISIWRDVLSLFKENWYAGVGIGRIKLLTDTERDAHNTIIELICSSGIFVGIYYIMYFLSAFVFAFKPKPADSNTKSLIQMLYITYLCLIILLTFITGIASVYLIYTAFLLFNIPRILENQNELSVSDLK